MARSPLPVLLIVTLALLAGCTPESETPERSAREGAPPARAARSGPAHCVAPEALPGSVPLAGSLRDAIAKTAFPPSGGRRGTCNRLALERGPFARLHATDAIDWRPWSPDALREAVALGRPVLVLSGSVACPACDELRESSLRGRRLVRDINRTFVPVLVDREERPDIDAYLMLATQVLTGGAGWPAVVFLLADGRPFEARSWGAAGTGDRALRRIVEDVRRRISLGGGTIEERAELTIGKMERRAGADTKGDMPDAAATATALRRYIAEAFDAESGAFGPPPLFPRPPIVDFLLDAGRTDEAALGIARAALERLRASPLADTVRGGFYRFAKEPGWKDPERVKLLGDNAAIASMYFHAADGTKDGQFAEDGRRVVDFLLRELRLADGAFAAGVDATGDAPRRDVRVFADANALAVSALVRASAATKEARYLDAAVAAAKILDVRLRDGSVMNHCIAAGGLRCPDGYLADQVFAAHAFLDLDAAAAPGGARWIEAAHVIADALPDAFGHAGTGGFFQTRSGSEGAPLRLKPVLDTVVPSANSAAARLYVRLAARTGEERYAKEATRTFEAFSEVLTLRPLAAPAMVAALVAQESAPPQLEPAPAVHP
jgi:uncharacterized protein YyaL (SSP411 family)